MREKVYLCRQLTNRPIMKEYKPIESEPLVAAEPAAAYGRVNTTPNSMKRMSRKDLEAECYSLEESKARLLELVNRHFHNR